MLKGIEDINAFEMVVGNLAYLLRAKGIILLNDFLIPATGGLLIVLSRTANWYDRNYISRVNSKSVTEILIEIYTFKTKIRHLVGGFTVMIILPWKASTYEPQPPNILLSFVMILLFLM